MENLVSITRGAVLVYRVFDIAEEIDLGAMERLLSSQGSGEARLRIASERRYALVMRNPPVRLSLGEVDLKIGTSIGKYEAFATIFDYGVVSISFQVPVPKGAKWDELIKLADSINQSATGPDEIDTVARRKSQELKGLIAGALKNPSEWNVFEDYVIFFLEEVAGIQKAAELVDRVDVPALILAEPQGTLAAASSKGITDSIFQYAQNDLAVIDWNSAIIVEPSGSREIADVLEFAVTHMLELRYYDDILDKRLADLYDMVEERRRGVWRGRFSRTSHEANTRYLEISEIIERVDNSLKIVGDFYFAVIFRGAVRRFRILDWQQSVTRKMQSMAKLSELLQGEVNVYRSHMLEGVIIFLILFEIVSAIVKY